MSADHEVYLDAAARIGRRLCRDAIWSDGQCNWLGWAMEPHGGQWVLVHRSMGPLIYDGSAGIGLFLARLAGVSGDTIIRTTAEAAMTQAASATEALGATGEYGFYSGLSGIAWACVEAGKELGHEDLARQGRAAMRAAARLPVRDDRLDVINGSAGLIPALIAAARSGDEEELLPAVVRHAEHLVALASRGEKGWSWNTLAMPDEPHLLGLAHGASGIAWALAEAGVAAGRGDFLDAARHALDYERSHFRPAEGNWPDLRSFVQTGTGPAPCMLAWCHGAPGIGLARLALTQLLPDDSAVGDEAETAIRTTATSLGQAGTGNFSLCHGDAGNADLLIEAAETLYRPDLRQTAEAVGGRAIERFEAASIPWPCGVPGAGETPNLMLGLAGIGYFLLRLNDARRFPTQLLPAAAEKAC